MVDVVNGEIAPVLGPSAQRSEHLDAGDLQRVSQHGSRLRRGRRQLPGPPPPAPRRPAVSPDQTLQAIVDIARNPWRNVGKLFTVAAASSAYAPALTRPPTPGRSR